MGGGFEPEDDGVVENASGSADSCGSDSDSAGGGGGNGVDDTPVAFGFALSGEPSPPGTRINVAHFGHFTRLPVALSGTRILLLQPLQVINMVLPQEKGLREG